jgi:DNA ligase 1
MLLSRLVEVSNQVAGARSRLKKRALLSRCLQDAGPGEIALIVHYLTGTLPQGRIGLGYKTITAAARAVADTGSASALTLRDVDAAFEALASTVGRGSQQARRERLAALFSTATAAEQDFLVRLILGELRQGALEGVLVDAIAEAAALPAGSVRRAVMLAGEAASVAEAALQEGLTGLARFRLSPLSPVKPMLAQPAADMDEAMVTLGRAALEYKLDGARVQVHKRGNVVRIFSRQLNDVTASLPEITEAAGSWAAQQLILDGEAIALQADGRPHPFQVTMRRFGRRSDVAAQRAALPLRVFLFDCLHHDGEDLIDRPYEVRFTRLAAAVPPEQLVPRTTTDDTAVADDFLADALAAGHEGVMAKSLTGSYAAGSRGSAWLKVKNAHTLDLVVLAVEWGSGRRQGWLSNLHLGARDPDSGGFVMLGKTFKGLTDAMLEWQTQKLLALETGRQQHVVHVRPELVVEIAVNEIQTSPHYPGGMALRFARVKRYREDKAAHEADTVATVRRLVRT